MAGATARAVVVPGTVFQPLPQQVVVADAQFQLKVEPSHLVNNFINITVTMLAFSRRHDLYVICTNNSVATRRPLSLSLFRG